MEGVKMTEQVSTQTNFTSPKMSGKEQVNEP